MNASFAITDFPDRLSPMVVKELRQGLRTRLFAGVLLTLHLMLVLLTLMSGGAENATVVSGWFDGIVTLVLCIIMPLRGFSAVADELKSGTLDMLALTRLSAGRIIFGKWAAIASQSLLLMLSILPYVVARFVFGGLDLFGEIAALFYKWLAGVVIAAVIVALSTQRQFWLRAVVVFLPLMMIGGCSAFSFMVMTSMGTSTTSGSTVTFFTKSGGASSALLLVGMAAWAIFFFLSLAATRIAPTASLLSVIKRSVHLVMILSLLLLGWLTGSGADMGMIAAGVLTLLMIDALTERVNEVPSVYAAFYQRGWPGRVALWLLAPGWVTGLVYSALLVTLVVVYVGWTRSVEEAKLVAVSACGTWMIAALVQLFSTRKSRDLLPPYIILWLFVNVVIATLGRLLAVPLTMRGVTASFTWALPQLLPIGYAAANAGNRDLLLNHGMLAASIWPALLLIASVFAWGHARAARQEGWRMIHGKKGGAEV